MLNFSRRSLLTTTGPITRPLIQLEIHAGNTKSKVWACRRLLAPYSNGSGSSPNRRTPPSLRATLHTTSTPNSASRSNNNKNNNNNKMDNKMENGNGTSNAPATSWVGHQGAAAFDFRSE